MKAELDLVYKALDKANKSGVFSLDESNQVLIAFSNIANKLKSKEEEKLSGNKDKDSTKKDSKSEDKKE